MSIRRHIETPDYHLTYDEAGRGGEPVVLVHASASAPTQWCTLLDSASLTHRRLRLLAPALVGYSGSRYRHTAVQDASLDVGALAAFIDAVAPHQPVHLVGHSYGGAAALALACAWSDTDRVQTLTLIEPARFNLLRHLGYDALHDEIRTISHHQIALTEYGSNEAAARSFIRYWSGRDGWDRMPPAARQKLAAAMPRVASEWRQIWRWDHDLAEVSAVRCPVQLITGGRSTAAALAVSQCLRALLPDARCRTIAPAGHLAPVTHPGEVNPWLLEHVSHGALSALRHQRMAS